jgi:sarcosine oxidase subunit alpha
MSWRCRPITETGGPGIDAGGRRIRHHTYGIEALSIMRMKRGMWRVVSSTVRQRPVISVLGKMMSSKKDYIGRMMAAREGLTDKSRQCVVGIRPFDAADKIRSGSHILKRDDAPSMAADQGYISSVAWSPC